MKFVKHTLWNAFVVLLLALAYSYLFAQEFGCAPNELCTGPTIYSPRLLPEKPRLVELFLCQGRTCVVVTSEDPQAEYVEVQLIYKTSYDLIRDAQDKPIELTLRKILSGGVIQGAHTLIGETDLEISKVEKIRVTLYRSLRSVEMEARETKP